MSDELTVAVVLLACMFGGAAFLALAEGRLRRPWFLRRSEYNEIRRWRRP